MEEVHAVREAAHEAGDIGFGIGERFEQAGDAGERMGAGKEQQVRPGADIDTDRVVGPDEAGLGTGLDEAEEALLERDRGEH